MSALFEIPAPGDWDAVLDALVSLQTAVSKTEGQGRWVDLTAASGIVFSTDTGTWRPAPVLQHLSYRIIGSELAVRFYIGLAAVTGPPNQLFIALPIPYRIVEVTGRPTGYLHGLTGHSVNHCAVLQDLDVYADGLAVLSTARAPVTLAITRLAAGTISGTGFAGAAGQVSGEIVATQ